MSNYKLDPSKSTPTAFIPRALEVEGRPELVVFSLNIMFMSFAQIDGIDSSGTALYYPDLGSFLADHRQAYMRYFNQIGHQDYIDLWYFKEFGWYRGEKFIGGRQVSISAGRDWKTFFIHLTSSGLAVGEQCEFKPINRE